jgi:hypothetical protein
MMFGHGWQKGEATIVAVHNKRTTGSGMVTIHEYLADVRTADRPTLRTVIQEPNICIDFAPPNSGSTVSVLIKGDKVKFDQDDPRISSKARKAAADARFASQVNGTGTRSTDSLAAVTGLPDIASLLGGQAGIEQIRAFAAQARASGSSTFVGGSAVPPAAPADHDDPAARLANLETLRQRGLMTDAEYATARKRIIDAL